jgi:hypothetical protein
MVEVEATDLEEKEIVAEKSLRKSPQGKLSGH